MGRVTVVGLGKDACGEGLELLNESDHADAL